jgi:hypothetical protein
MLFVDIKYAKMIGPRLERWKIKKDDFQSFVSQFRCNICGDSDKSEKKTRGNFFVHDGDLMMHCYNCGASHGFGQWLKDFDSNMYAQYKVEKFSTTKYSFDVPKPLLQSNTHLITVFDELNTIEELPPNTEAKKYVLDRKIPREFWSKLYYAPNYIEWARKHTDKFDNPQCVEHSRLVIPWLNKEGDAFAYHARAFGKSLNKYYSITLDPKHTPKVYGLDRLDLSKQRYVLEGPIDSMFIPNAIAVGTSTLYMYEDADAIYLPDMEPRNREIVKIIGKMVRQGLRVCFMPDSWTFKDINEAVMAGFTSKEILDTINKNVYKGLRAEMKYNSWKKV